MGEGQALGQRSQVREAPAYRDTPRSTSPATDGQSPRPSGCSSGFLQAAGKFCKMPGVLLTLQVGPRGGARGHPARGWARVSQEGGLSSARGSPSSQSRPRPQGGVICEGVPPIRGGGQLRPLMELWVGHRPADPRGVPTGRLREPQEAMRCHRVAGRPGCRSPGTHRACATPHLTLPLPRHPPTPPPATL